MLVELAVGDAYGAGFEFAPPSVVRWHNTVDRYIRHPKHTLPAGSYTDDTQMTLAIAEALLAEQPWTREHLAARFVEVFQRDPRAGYARRFYAFLQEVKSGEEFLERMEPTSDRSGAAMRATPLGLLPSIPELIEKCRLQAAITHNTDDGIHAALASALMTHFFAYQLGCKRELPAFLCQHVPGDWDKTWVGKVEHQGWMSVRAAITALVRNHRLSDLLVDCVSFTGDVDTVATIALAAASCSSEYEQQLPAVLLDQLENGPFGRDYLADLDRRLFQRFGLTPLRK